MKFLLTLLFSLTLLSSFAQVNQKDANGKRHGKWEKFYNNGKLRYQGQFNHGKETGIFKFYFESGDIQAVNHFRGKTGICYSYQFGGDSILAAEGKYVDSKRDSIWTFYDLEGNIVAKENYKNGKQHGLTETYFADGKVAEFFNYQNGDRSGEWKQFYENGRPKARGQYVNGSLSGEVMYYHPSGKLSAKGNYIKGLMHGNWYFFNENMEVEKKQVWKYGSMLSQEPPAEEEEDQKGIEPMDEGIKRWQK